MNNSATWMSSPVPQSGPLRVFISSRMKELQVISKPFTMG
jgi:hypothetical protein